MDFPRIARHLVTPLLLVASLATVGALIGLTLEMRKSRQIENRQILFESLEKWENLREERKRFNAMLWEDLKISGKNTKMEIEIAFRPS